MQALPFGSTWPPCTLALERKGMLLSIRTRVPWSNWAFWWTALYLKFPMPHWPCLPFATFCASQVCHSGGAEIRYRNRDVLLCAPPFWAWIWTLFPQESGK